MIPLKIMYVTTNKVLFVFNVSVNSYFESSNLNQKINIMSCVMSEIYFRFASLLEGISYCIVCNLKKAIYYVSNARTLCARIVAIFRL